jgi:hypothetical protein
MRVAEEDGLRWFRRAETSSVPLSSPTFGGLDDETGCSPGESPMGKCGSAAAAAGQGRSDHARVVKQAHEVKAQASLRANATVSLNELRAHPGLNIPRPLPGPSRRGDSRCR